MRLSSKAPIPKQAAAMTINGRSTTDTDAAPTARERTIAAARKADRVLTVRAAPIAIGIEAKPATPTPPTAKRIGAASPRKTTAEATAIHIETMKPVALARRS